VLKTKQSLDVIVLDKRKRFKYIDSIWVISEKREMMTVNLKRLLLRLTLPRFKTKRGPSHLLL